MLEHVPRLQAEIKGPFSKLESPKLSAREIFLEERFSKLSDILQSVILARMLVWHRLRNKALAGGSLSSAPGVRRVVTILRRHSREWRVEKFRSLVALDAAAPDHAALLLLKAHRKYFPALLVALNAAYRGDDIGLLTARGNRRGHLAVIQVIESFLGFKIERRNIYFVNDDSRNQRLGNVSTAEKKLLVLRNFVEGMYHDEQGKEQPMSAKYRRVYFYDDEPRNLQTVNLFAASRGWEDRLIAVDPFKLSCAALWRSLVKKVLRGSFPAPGRRRVMHFFDIDGTLMQVDACMYVIDKLDGKRLLMVTQEAFAEHPVVQYWLEQAKLAHPDIPGERIEMDFADFRDATRVEKLIEDKQAAGSLFRNPRRGRKRRAAD